MRRNKKGYLTCRVRTRSLMKHAFLGEKVRVEVKIESGSTIPAAGSRISSYPTALGIIGRSTNIHWKVTGTGLGLFTLKTTRFLSAISTCNNNENDIIFP